MDALGDARGKRPSNGPARRGLSKRLSFDDFLPLEGPSGIAVVPDAPRDVWFSHLGLDRQLYRHRRIYRKMKQEARAGANRLFSTRRSLRLNLFDDDTITPPFHRDQMSDEAVQTQVDVIFEMASRSTKGIYRLVRTPTGGNWVIEWLLHRAIRQRQPRQRYSVTSPTESSRISTETSPGSLASSTLDHIPPASSTHTSPFWSLDDTDTARESDSDEWDEPEPEMESDCSSPASQTSTSSRSVYWAHVLGNDKANRAKD